MPIKYTDVVTVRLEPGARAKLNSMSNMSGVSPSSMARLLIMAGIDRNSKRAPRTATGGSRALYNIL